MARHNHREWFLAHKQVYEQQVRGPMVELIESLNAAMMEFAPAYVTDPAKAIYRVYRDTRFSADKTPYKTNIAASFYRRGAEKHGAAGYYVGVGPREVEVGGGLYLPPPEAVRAMRSHFAEHHEEFRRLAESRTMRRLLGEVQGARLRRVPKGYACDHPGADLLRLKQCYFYVVLDPAMATTASLYKAVLKRFRAMSGCIDFLNKALIPGRRKPSPLDPLYD
ncbi:MAG: DUF2461 domain-containing protein [Acidobacteria bacterium]|nr:DUF2461 domain-containing protein [Acidobacteriota bacterium]